jgi:hypothetical protein
MIKEQRLKRKLIQNMDPYLLKRNHIRVIQNNKKEK